MEKQIILQEVERRLKEKIEHLEFLISEARASNNDTKSSMGDKYETSREMLQQEINNLLSQLSVFLEQQIQLKSLSVNTNSKVEKGALVQTQNGWFYISISLGELKLDSKKIYAISPDSPLAKAMWNLEEGQEFSLNSSVQKIETIS